MVKIARATTKFEIAALLDTAKALKKKPANNARIAERKVYPIKYFLTWSASHRRHHLRDCDQKYSKSVRRKAERAEVAVKDGISCQKSNTVDPRKTPQFHKGSGDST